jgi:hypothetical protein
LADEGFFDAASRQMVYALINSVSLRARNANRGVYKDGSSHAANSLRAKLQEQLLPAASK